MNLKFIYFLLIVILFILIISIFYPSSLLLFPALTSIIPLIYLIKKCFKKNLIQENLFPIVYMLGTVNCWAIAFLICYYLEFTSISDFEFAKYPLITLTLANITTWFALFGNLVANSKKGEVSRQKQLLLTDSKKFSEKFLSAGLKISSLIFVFYVFMYWRFGGFNTRYEIGNTLPTGSTLYWLGGLAILLPVCFFFFGASLSKNLISLKNIFLFIGLFIGVFFLTLSGDRGRSLQFIIFFLSGSLLISKLSRNKIILALALLLSVFLIWSNVLSYIRITSAFASANLFERINLGIEFMLEGGTDQTNFDGINQYYGLFTRMTEPSGSLVIDSLVENPEYIGITANLNRVYMLFIPKFILGEKNYSDNNERLEKYGIYARFNSAAPLTLMGDSYERDGIFGVAVISFLISFLLTHINHFLIRRMKNKFLSIFLFISYAVNSYFIYTYPVLGVIDLFTYRFLRDAIIIYLVYQLIVIISSRRIVL
jgi:hypothetical protein